MKIQKFEGLVAAPFTPMDKGGNINYDMIKPYYDFLEKNGVVGAFINGTTGEGASLTHKEKQLQAEKWAGCYGSGGKLRVINLVGGTSYSECIENAVFSSEIGISAIAIVAPYYFRPVETDHLADFIARIGESVPQMPVYFYHIPSLTGVNLPMLSFMEKITSRLPNFAGVKYTHEDFADFLSCLNFRDGAFDLLWGKDECLLPALSLGCKGCVGSTYNFAVPLYHDLIGAFNKGNLAEARRLQQISIDMISLSGKFRGIATGKAYMKYIGIDCGQFRSPLKNMPDEMYNEFVNDVRSLGIDDLFSKR
jgi:N-acetylneuraminate lyase